MSKTIKRRVGDAVCIGGDTWVTVIKVKGQTVTLEIDAPIHVPVFRSEEDDRDASCADI